ncbi:hypothetical protein METBIDRAFT_139613 [Metschnikowia bicuspidata var. bicuspidata NRRL YB-4993]|uniref:Uncharacterized protein n=1 Tax=Metschnikowia bicuspidata var. bicuspidata NRRL YB-4993 TaxID=869754 RepID=A0A1A0HCR6_9ASCO|nr:hypothetical protein METBIDRAFT_139613 [Metschnikowia bicuspidata var. bicuspidata NRRL YB-4993]OBA21889.1 hypothetical protein METBIDRAFT_139613 [Metschnikowia bicuspidata var. bicuspidata NRRL YB-4993]
MSSLLRQDPFRLLPTERNSTRGTQSSERRKTDNGTSSIPADEFDDDAEMNTPHAIREASRPYCSNVLLSKSSSSVFVRRSEAADFLETPIKERNSRNDIVADGIDGNEPRLLHAGMDPVGYPELPPKEVLVDENNNLTTHPTSLSPPQKHLSGFERDLNRMEFDPSDYELPEKSMHALSSNRGMQKTVLPRPYALDESVRKRPQISSVPSYNLPNPPHNADRTPRRLSPLKNVLIPSSGSRSSPSTMLEEIRNSGALQPRTAREIQDQINSSLRQLEQSDLTSESQDSSSLSESEDDSDEDDSDEDDFLDHLGQYIPSVEKRKPTEHAPSVSEDQSTKTVEQNLPPADSLTAHLLPKNDALHRVKRSRTRRTGKLSGKYARKKIKDTRQKVSKKKYGDWLADQWDKLRRLLDLSVPNSVVANSYIVMRELNCTNKQELALRVKFLENQGKARAQK